MRKKISVIMLVTVVVGGIVGCGDEKVVSDVKQNSSDVAQNQKKGQYKEIGDKMKPLRPL
jgi:hypothetical protein